DHRSRRFHPRGAGGGRRSRIRCQMVPSHRGGGDADHPEHGQQISGGPMIEVLSVTSEIYPLVKTGGLADVAGALPAALAGTGVTMRTLVPGYPAVIDRMTNGREVARFDDLFGVVGRLLAGRVDGLDLIMLDAPALYDRPGNPYMGPEGWDWPDNWRRFAALSWAASELGLG